MLGDFAMRESGTTPWFSPLGYSQIMIREATTTPGDGGKKATLEFDQIAHTRRFRLVTAFIFLWMKRYGAKNPP